MQGWKRAEHAEASGRSLRPCGAPPPRFLRTRPREQRRRLRRLKRAPPPVAPPNLMTTEAAIAAAAREGLGLLFACNTHRAFDPFFTTRVAKNIGEDRTQRQKRCVERNKRLPRLKKRNASVFQAARWTTWMLDRQAAFLVMAACAARHLGACAAKRRSSPRYPIYS